MPKGEVKKRKEYIDWITNVQKDSHLSQGDFAEKIVRFSKDGTECKHYSRSAVVKWEQGTNLPVNMETVISIAIIDYSNQHPEQNFDTFNTVLTSSARNARLTYVSNCLRKYLNRRLYCRNLQDVLLFQAIRGLLPLEQVPQKWKEMKQELLKANKTYSAQKIREYAISRNTNTLYHQLLEKQDFESFFQKFREQKEFFAVGYRVIGERLREEYKEKYQAKRGLSFHQAVALYAPVYRDSYKRLLSYDIMVSRRWLIDFCLQLHFSGDSINLVLRNAQYSGLSSDSNNPEAWILEENFDSCGSILWYARMERKYLQQQARGVNFQQLQEDGVLEYDFEPYRFWRVQTFSLCERLFYALGICLYLKENIDLPLPVYLLDYALARKEMEKYLKDLKNSNQYDMNKIMQCGHEICMRIVEAMDDVEYDEEALSQIQRTEYKWYYEIPENKVASDRKKFTKQYTFAAILYSLLTGFLYKGQINPQEYSVLEQIQEQSPLSYNAIRYIWRLYLDTEPVGRGKNGGFCIRTQTGVTPELDVKSMSEILGAVIERSWV